MAGVEDDEIILEEIPSIQEQKTTTTPNNNNNSAVEPKTGHAQLNFDLLPKEAFLQVSNIEIGRTFHPYLTQIFQTGENADLSLKFGGTERLLHQIVIHMWCPELLKKIEYLTETVASGMRKATYEFKPEFAFVEMLGFMYAGAISTSFDTKEKLVDLLLVADKHNFEELKIACANNLAKLNNAQNLVPQFIEWAEKYSCPRLKEHAGILLAENFNQLMETNQLMELDVSVWEGILQSTKIKVENEESLFSFVLIYAEQFQHNKIEQEKVISRLLQHLYYEAMAPEFLIEQVEPMIPRFPELKKRLYTAFKSVLFDKELRSREYDRVLYKWKKKGPQITLSHGDKQASCTVAWNQIQADKPILPGQYFEIKIVSMVNKATNSYGIVVGVGPHNSPLSGGGAIIGYSGQQGYGWVLGDGQLFPTTFGRANETADTGDTIRVALTTKNELSFYKNKKFVVKITLQSHAKLYPMVAMSGGTIELV